MADSIDITAFKVGELVKYSSNMAVLKVKSSLVFFDGGVPRVLYELASFDGQTCHATGNMVQNQDAIENSYSDSNAKTWKDNLIVASLEVPRIYFDIQKAGVAFDVPFKIFVNGAFITNLVMDFGDGSAPVLLDKTASQLSVVSDKFSHTYSKAGYYLAVMNIFDDKNHQVMRGFLVEVTA